MSYANPIYHECNDNGQCYCECDKPLHCMGDISAPVEMCEALWMSDIQPWCANRGDGDSDDADKGRSCGCACDDGGEGWSIGGGNEMHPGGEMYDLTYWASDSARSFHATDDAPYANGPWGMTNNVFGITGEGDGDNYAAMCSGNGNKFHECGAPCREMCALLGINKGKSAYTGWGTGEHPTRGNWVEGLTDSNTISDRIDGGHNIPLNVDFTLKENFVDWGILTGMNYCTSDVQCATHCENFCKAPQQPVFDASEGTYVPPGLPPKPSQSPYTAVSIKGIAVTASRNLGNCNSASLSIEFKQVAIHPPVP